MVEMVETAAILNQATAQKPGDPGRDRPRHGDLRRSLDRLGDARASARRQPLPRAVRHALPRAGRAQGAAGGARALHDARQGMAERGRVPARGGAGRRRPLLRHPRRPARRPARRRRGARRGGAGGAGEGRAVGRGERGSPTTCRCLPPHRRGRRAAWPSRRNRKSRRRSARSIPTSSRRARRWSCSTPAPAPCHADSKSIMIMNRLVSSMRAVTGRMRRRLGLLPVGERAEDRRQAIAHEGEQQAVDQPMGGGDGGGVPRLGGQLHRRPRQAEPGQQRHRDRAADQQEEMRPAAAVPGRRPGAATIGSRAASAGSISTNTDSRRRRRPRRPARRGAGARAPIASRQSDGGKGQETHGDGRAAHRVDFIAGRRILEQRFLDPAIEEHRVDQREQEIPAPVMAPVDQLAGWLRARRRRRRRDRRSAAPSARTRP